MPRCYHWASALSFPLPSTISALERSLWLRSPFPPAGSTINEPASTCQPARPARTPTSSLWLGVFLSGAACRRPINWLYHRNAAVSHNHDPLSAGGTNHARDHGRAPSLEHLPPRVFESANTAPSRLPSTDHRQLQLHRSGHSQSVTHSFPCFGAGRHS